MGLRRQLTDSPGRTVLFSIFVTICLGTILLMLPHAQKTHIPFIDCFFTATSATCVTGVLTIPFDSFTLFGKCVILALIQIGGIGLLTLWLSLISLFVNLGISTQYLIGQVYELAAFKNPKRILFLLSALLFWLSLLEPCVFMRSLRQTILVMSPFLMPFFIAFHLFAMQD